MTFGSLFAGIGGLDLGLERAGMTCKWQVEIDPYCRAVLAKHWPDVPRWDDATTFPPDASSPRCGSGQPEASREIRHETRRQEPERRDRRWTVDLICGGFPCQPVSHAGKRAGTSDSRWLWPEFERIVCLLRPRYVLVENVPGLLTVNRGDAFGEVLGGLASCGYDAEWTSIPAAAVGAPHLRWRVFIVAYATGVQRTRQQTGLVGAGQGRSGLSNGSQDVADAEEFGHQGAGAIADGQSCRADQVDVPDAERNRVGSGLCPDEAGRQRRGRSDDLRSPIPDTTGSRLQERDRIFTRRESPRPTVEASQWWSVEPDVGQLVDELPANVARLVRERVPDLAGTIPRVATGIPHRVDRLKSLGNAVVPAVAEWIGRQIIEAEDRMR